MKKAYGIGLRLLAILSGFIFAYFSYYLIDSNSGFQLGLYFGACAVYGFGAGRIARVLYDYECSKEGSGQ